MLTWRKLDKRHGCDLSRTSTALSNRSAWAHGWPPLRDREPQNIATRQTPVHTTDPLYLVADDKAEPLDAGLLREEQVRALRIAAERLPLRCQRLLGLLMGDDDLPYKEIGNC